MDAEKTQVNRVRHPGPPLGIVATVFVVLLQIARYLYAQGMQVCGIDLSSEMVQQAQGLNPHIPFQQGDMFALSEVADNSYGGIAAFYSIVNLPRPSVVRALQELRRVLSPNGVLLLTFHVGQGITHLNEFLGKEVSLDFIFFETEEVKEYLRTAGFELEEAIERDPYSKEIEHQSRRAYIFARKA
jgi:ubiquinone/menaquinone biosynthesis C-methylase UbiE